MEIVLWVTIGFVVGVLATLLVINLLRNTRLEAARQDNLSSEGSDHPPAGDVPALDAGGEVAALRQNLRVRLLYDEAKIDRLIAAERERSPQDSLAQLMRTANERLDRENQ